MSYPLFTFGRSKRFLCPATGQLLEAGVTLDSLYPRMVFCSWGAVLAYARDVGGLAVDSDGFAAVVRAVADVSGMAPDALRPPGSLLNIRPNDPESVAEWRKTDCTQSVITGFKTVAEVEEAEKQKKLLAKAKAAAEPRVPQPVVYQFPIDDAKPFGPLLNGSNEPVSAGEWVEAVNAFGGERADADLQVVALDDTSLLFGRPKSANGDVKPINKRVRELLGVNVFGPARLQCLRNGSTHKAVKKALCEQLKATKPKSDSEAAPKPKRIRTKKLAGSA